MKKGILIAILLMCTGILNIARLHAQDKSNKGKEFWLGYGYNSWFFVADGGPSKPSNSQELILYLTTEAAANVTVSIPNTDGVRHCNVPANTVNASILIPKTGANDARIVSEGLSDRAIHILSDTPIVVFAHMYNSQTSGATMLIPVETYGYKYYSLNYTQSQSNSRVPYSYSNTTANGANYWYSWFYVVASEDNTRLEITPSDTTKTGGCPARHIP
ncbi:MAG: IgGFc-binding protein [Chitinophagaceae bacterium]|nr:IgGFc-binding protein [Chitinophagaceae bacterium]